MTLLALRPVSPSSTATWDSSAKTAATAMLGAGQSGEQATVAPSLPGRECGRGAGLRVASSSSAKAEARAVAERSDALPLDEGSRAVTRVSSSQH